MRLVDDTEQRRAVALLEAPPADLPVKVDVAMKRRAAEYTGPPTPYDRDGAAWWRKVSLMAAHH